MAQAGTRTEALLQLVRNGRELSRWQRVQLVVLLSLPAILAELSSICMEYIDAAMVGHLGSTEAAGIGLVMSSTWVFWGLASVSAAGFTVQVAHRIGAKDYAGARSVLRQSIVVVFLVGSVLTTLGACISGALPHWLGGDASICGYASSYFLIIALSVPALQLYSLSGGMLRRSGNLRLPSTLSIIMCVMDVVFNALFIFPTREYEVWGMSLTVPGAGLGVTGAALGTALALLLTALLMAYFLFFRSPELKLTQDSGSYGPRRDCVRSALRICVPMGFERMGMSFAYVACTYIVAPLGVIPVATHSLAITAESLCYMPGYGIGEAATTLIGQCTGAGRRLLTRSFARMCVALGMGVMAVSGFFMYLAAPWMMAFLTDNLDIIRLGSEVLRIEAVAEPLYAASIVGCGVFVGAGDTFKPCLMNLFSMWAVRLSAAAWLAGIYGLKGVWMAMCGELCFRGIIFLLRLRSGAWVKKAL